MVAKNFESSNVVNIAGVLYIWVLMPAYASAQYTPALVLEKPVYVREMSDGLYRSITYAVFKTFEEVLVAATLSALISLPVYFIVAFQGNWIVFWLSHLLVQAIGIVLAFFVAAATNNMDAAVAIVPVVVTVFQYFAGFLIQVEKIRWYWRWMVYVDFMRFSWGALMINEFKGRNVIAFDNQEVLDYYSLGGTNKWAYIGYLAIEFAVVFFAFWLVMTFKTHSKR
jgi:ABC-type multidrug transport system permease subunit